MKVCKWSVSTVQRNRKLNSSLCISVVSENVCDTDNCFLHECVVGLFSKNLQRLCQQFSSKREVKPPPALPDYSRQENRFVRSLDGCDRGDIP